MSWFSHFATAFAANVATNVWLGFPFMMVVTLGALTSIPKEVLEAAEVDGATRWQRFWRVTLPLLAPDAPAGRRARQRLDLQHVQRRVPRLRRRARRLDGHPRAATPTAGPSRATRSTATPPPTRCSSSCILAGLARSLGRRTPARPSGGAREAARRRSLAHAVRSCAGVRVRRLPAPVGRLGRALAGRDERPRRARCPWPERPSLDIFARGARASRDGRSRLFAAAGRQLAGRLPRHGARRRRRSRRRPRTRSRASASSGKTGACARCSRRRCSPR